MSNTKNEPNEAPRSPALAGQGILVKEKKEVHAVFL
jgi:hypothetical protein